MKLELVYLKGFILFFSFFLKPNQSKPQAFCSWKCHSAVCVSECVCVCVWHRSSCQSLFSDVLMGCFKGVPTLGCTYMSVQPLPPRPNTPFFKIKKYICVMFALSLCINYEIAMRKKLLYVLEQQTVLQMYFTQ